MARPEAIPFTSDAIEAAGRLLAARHTAHRTAEPLLSPEFEDPQATTALVHEAWERDGASGAVAVDGDKVVGYVIGAPRDATWGPNVWVESAGHAVDEAGVARDLYGLAASRWVDEGRTAHYALIPAYDTALVDAWSRVGFGQQQMHAVQEVPSGPLPIRADCVVRRAVRADIPALAALELVLPEHQGRSPVFSALATPTLDEVRAEWEDDFDDPAYAVFVAEHDGRVIGSAIGCSIEKSSSNSGLIRPNDAGFLGFAAVFAESRGLGAGRALGDAVAIWAAEAGYASIATDWRVTNLLSSRAWPALGYRNTFVRVHRVTGY